MPRCDAKISSQASIQSWQLTTQIAPQEQTAQAARDSILRWETAREVLPCEDRAPASHQPARPCTRGTQRAALSKCGSRDALALT